MECKRGSASRKLAEDAARYVQLVLDNEVGGIVW
jgi:hypothetical protein